MSPDIKNNWPQNEKYPSPFFSFEMKSPKLVKQRLEALYGTFGENRAVVVRLGPPSDGVVGTPEVDANNLKHTRNAHELDIPINLPILDFTPQYFLNSQGSFFSTERRKANSMKKAIKKYLGKDMEIRSNLDGHEFTPISKNKSSLGTKAKTWIRENGSCLRHIMSPTILANKSDVGNLFFEKEIKDAMTLSLIYVDYLLNYLEITPPPSKIIIDPDKFQIVASRPIDLVKYYEGLREQFITDAIFTGKPMGELMVADNSLNPDAQSDKIMISKDGEIIFPPDRHSFNI